MGEEETNVPERFAKIISLKTGQVTACAQGQIPHSVWENRGRFRHPDRGGHLRNPAIKTGESAVIEQPRVEKIVHLQLLPLQWRD
jgi:hypothetical protein